MGRDRRAASEPTICVQSRRMDSSSSRSASAGTARVSRLPTRTGLRPLPRVPIVTNIILEAPRPRHTDTEGVNRRQIDSPWSGPYHGAAMARPQRGQSLSVTIEEIEEASPYRIEAPCPYFGRCGGCKLQHVDYQAQLSFKSKQVVDSLERIGGLETVEVRPIVPAENTYGYRNKMEFTVARARGRDGLTIGLHEAERYDSVLDVERCLLQSDRMNTQLDEARRFLAESGLSAWDQDSGEGLLRFLMLREGYRTGETMVNVVTSSPAVSELAP